MTISALKVQLNCSLVTKNIDVFALAPHFLPKCSLITISVHGTLLYFISLISDKISYIWFAGPSGDACWFLCVIKSI